MKEINRWCAEQCGAQIVHDAGDKGLCAFHEDCPDLVIWTIEDARCREVVLDHFAKHKDYNYYNTLFFHINRWLNGFCSKKEAEINCIMKLYESAN